MRSKVDFETGNDVKKFTDAVKNINSDVILTGKDENGNDWRLSAKSFLASLVIAANVQNRKHTAHDVDWNTIWCECEEDITRLIMPWIM